MLEVLQYGVCAALVGVVYASVLPDDPSPLSRWFSLLAKAAEGPGEWKGWSVRNVLAYCAKSVVQWFAYPLGYCAKCTSGHIALWSYLHFHGFEKVNVIPAVLSACIAILSAQLLIKTYEWSK